jgi:hypothetical protein
VLRLSYYEIYHLLDNGLNCIEGKGKNNGARKLSTHADEHGQVESKRRDGAPTRKSLRCAPRRATSEARPPVLYGIIVLAVILVALAGVVLVYGLRIFW